MKDKGGILGFGILGSREKMERCRKSDGKPKESDFGIKVVPSAKKAFGLIGSWWILPDHNFTNRIPVRSLEEGIQRLWREFKGVGVVIHIDDAWTY